MKIIIVGAGKVGSTLAEQLCKEGHDISIIDSNEQVIEQIANSFDVLGVTGHGASYSIQKEAGVENADLLIAVTGSDELNLLCCLIARKAGKCKTIARVRDPIYNKENSFIKEEIGLAMVINPEYEAASEITRILRFPSVIDINTFYKGRVDLLSFKVEDNSNLHNIQVKDIRRIFKCDILVSIVEREEEIIIPNGEFTIQKNDMISIIASHKEAIEFFVKIGMIKNPVKNTMLIGGGQISYYLTKQLLKRGINVTIVEQDRERCEHLAEAFPEAMIIHGDGTDHHLLMEEGIDEMESLVSVTGIDEENILLSLYARSKMSGKIITKVNRLAFDEVINSLDLGSIIYPKYITSQYILQHVRAMNNTIGSNVETLYKIKKDKAEALEFCVNEGSKLIGVPLEKIKLKENLIIASIYRKGKLITPKGQDSLESGDHVIVVTTNMGLHDLSDILRS